VTTHQVELVVPDLGEFSDVDVIEVLVGPGDKVAIEESLITLETDKASMDVPSTHAGVVSALKVKVGDKVNAGDVILTLDATELFEPEATVMLAPEEQQKILAAVAAEAEGREKSGTSHRTQLVVIGSGPGGYTAAFRAADLGLQVTLVVFRQKHCCMRPGSLMTRQPWQITVSASANPESMPWRCAAGRTRSLTG